MRQNYPARIDSHQVLDTCNLISVLTYSILTFAVKFSLGSCLNNISGVGVGIMPEKFK